MPMQRDYLQQMGASSGLSLKRPVPA
jgi:hypothetical protein